MTAPEIKELLLDTPPEKRLAVAARLIALALANNELLDGTADRLPVDRDLMFAHLRGKLGRAA